MNNRSLILITSIIILASVSVFLTFQMETRDGLTIAQYIFFSFMTFMFLSMPLLFLYVKISDWWDNKNKRKNVKRI